MDEQQLTSKRIAPDFDETLEALRTTRESEAPNATIFYGLSGLSLDNIEQLKSVWETLSPAYRHKIVHRMLDLSETNVELDYRIIGNLGLDDGDADVRQAAIELLWLDESLDLMARLIDISQWDEHHEVRAAAASALGRFILLGELGDLSESKTVSAQDAVLNLWNNVDEGLVVRRRALEAISNCGHPIVPDAIREAYGSSETLMRVSAVFAMGKTCDNRWEKHILREMDSDTSEMRYEAARAAGELELAMAIPKLAQLTLDEDDEIRDAAIWSLGEIGNREAVRVLEKLAQDAYDEEDQELIETIEDAIASASLVGGDIPFMLDVDDDPELDEYDQLDD